MSLGPWIGGRLYDALGSYFWLFIGSAAIGLGAVAIALTFRPPRTIPAALPSPARRGLRTGAISGLGQADSAERHGFAGTLRTVGGYGGPGRGPP